MILLPAGPSTFPAVKRAVIAWDASVEAAKAVRDAIGLMQRAERVTAVLIDPVPSFEGMDRSRAPISRSISAGTGSRSRCCAFRARAGTWPRSCSAPASTWRRTC